MTITVADFRTNFPAYASVTRYPDGEVQFWMTLAYLLLPADRWGDILDMGVQLYVAHNLSLEALAKKQGGTGGIPGASSGMLNSKSIDKVSAGYDTASVAEQFAGSYNLTTYGMRLWKLIQQFGAGPIQVGAGPGNAPPSQIAWYGPYWGAGF
jgi:hypothetical protein